jgi:hypothetical protein
MNRTLKQANKRVLLRLNVFGFIAILLLLRAHPAGSYAIKGRYDCNKMDKILPPNQGKLF